ncbi:MAG: sulfotransferase [Bacteroidetes bacterium]|jgi:hypothetical protein|nr:sulfotransferase [Bacteroidota bacterium]
MQSKTLMVVGMHRSGTSLISNWLYRCGLHLGEHLLEAGNGNAEGHFEDVEFLKMHEEILTSNAFPASGYVYDKVIDISVYHLEKLKSVIKVKNQLYRQWGWKEPRTCLFLDLYRELLPNSKYLVIVRDYAAVVYSLLKRDFAEYEEKYLRGKKLQRFLWLYFRRHKTSRKFYKAHAEDYLKVYIEYNQHILHTLKELAPEDYMVVNYSLLEKSDKEVFSFLTGKWHFKLQYHGFNEVYKKNLLSKAFNVDAYINDKELIDKAKSITDELKKHIIIH